MNTSGRQMAFALVVLGVVAGLALPLSAEVLEITGTSTARVVRYEQGTQIEIDVANQSVPGTIAVPPAVSRARLDHVLSGGSVTAAGQAVSVLDSPTFNAFGRPSDVGMDLGAFSDDEVTSWRVDGTVTERRTIKIQNTEGGGSLSLAGFDKAQSTLYLSGVLFITSLDATADLTGVSAEVTFGVTQFLPSLDGEENPVSVLAGSVSIVGGPNGTIEVGTPSGVFETHTVAVVDFSYQIPGLPLVRAIVFGGMEFPYEYDTVGGNPFEMELVFESHLRAIPGGTGAAAVFGLPQEGFGAAFGRVKNNDRGVQLASLISEQVDTTGAAYTNSGPGWFPNLFTFCGMMGIEVVGVTIIGGFVSVVRFRRRHHRRHRRFVERSA